MATQELAGFLAMILLASKTGLIKKITNTENGNGGPYGSPEPPQEEDKPVFPDSGVCLTKAQYVKRWGPVTEQEYREYIQMSGCRIIPA